MNRALRLSVSFAVVAALVSVGGCSSSSSSPATGQDDAGAADSAPDVVCGDAGYACGQPCDPGNSIGVGYFCNTISDCEVTPQAHLCATLGNPDEHFCTFICDPGPDGGDAGDPCGENATCECQGGQCGCTPNYCLGDN
jgi:hypothetical protein